MNLSNEKMVDMVEYDVDMTAEEAKVMRDYGLERIEKDEKALINYAFVSMLTDMVEQLKDPAQMKEFKKQFKNNVDKPEKSDKIVDEIKTVEKKKRGRPAKGK